MQGNLQPINDELFGVLGFRVFKVNDLFSIHLETVVSMDATCCFTRHIQTRNDLASLVNAFSIHGAFQTAHAVVDHRGDDSDIEGLGSHLNRNSIGTTKLETWSRVRICKCIR